MGGRTHSGGVDDGVRERNARLLRERLEVEIADAQAYLEAEAGRLFPGLMGRLLNPMVRTLLHWVGHAEMAKRARAQLEVVMRAAEDLERMSMEEVLLKHRAALLATEELYARGNRNHRAFPLMMRYVEAQWPGRLRTVHRFLQGAGGAATFEGGIRNAFPERVTLQRELLAQVAGTQGAMVVLEREPGVARVPGFLQGPLFALARNALGWYERRLLAFLDEVYGPPSPPEHAG